MNKKLKAKWVAALRSSEYEQGCGVLYNPDDGSFCCLGVLCHVAGVPTSRMGLCHLPADVGKEEVLPTGWESVFTEANDIHEWTFDDIASYVEVML